MRIIGHYATITDRRAASESIWLLSVPGSTEGSTWARRRAAHSLPGAHSAGRSTPEQASKEGSTP